MILINDATIDKIQSIYGDEILDVIRKTKEKVEEELKNNTTVSLFFDEEIHHERINIAFGFVKNNDSYMHNHNFYELIYAINVPAIEFIDGKYYVIEKGDVFIVPPALSHFTTCPDAEGCIVFQLRKEWLHKKADEFSAYDRKNHLSTFIESSSYAFLTNNTSDDFDTIMQKLKEINRSVYRNASLNNNLNFEYLFSLALVALTKFRLTTSANEHLLNEYDTKISAIMDYIVENYNKTGIEDIAEHFGYSKTQIHRLVKAGTGTTVSKHLTEIKLRRAKLLLLNSNLSIDAIAHEVGFENPDCFAKMFKRARGITPYKYRKIHPYVGNRSSIKD